MHNNLPAYFSTIKRTLPTELPTEIRALMYTFAEHSVRSALLIY